jgi:hypothetical protein
MPDRRRGDEDWELDGRMWVEMKSMRLNEGVSGLFHSIQPPGYVLEIDE